MDFSCDERPLLAYLLILMGEKKNRILLGIRTAKEILTVFVNFRILFSMYPTRELIVLLPSIFHVSHAVIYYTPR